MPQSTINPEGSREPASFLSRASHQWKSLQRTNLPGTNTEKQTPVTELSGAPMFPKGSVHTPIKLTPALSFPIHLWLWAPAGWGLSPIYLCITDSMQQAFRNFLYCHMKAYCHSRSRIPSKRLVHRAHFSPSLPAPAQVSPLQEITAPPPQGAIRCSLLPLPEDPVQAC